MSSERMRELLAELNRELHNAGDFDPETRDALRQLNEDLDEVAGNFRESALDRAKLLESRFAASHPVAERIARELADVLAKLGI